MLWVGGGVAVVPLSVVLVTVLVRAPPVELWVWAPPVMPKARALHVMPWWMVVFDRWGWDLATPGGGSHGRCWSVCWPWPPLVSLMPMVLYRVVSPCWLSLTLPVAVAEVALSVGGGVGDAGGDVVAGVVMVYGVSDVADAAGGWCGSVFGWSVACVRGWALAGSCSFVWGGVQ